MPHIPLKLDPAPLHKHIERTVRTQLAAKTAKSAGSALKDSTKRLMEVLKKIRAKRGAVANAESVRGVGRMKQRISIPSERRAHLAQSHKQAKKMGRGKGYRQYLKREI